MLDPNNSAPPAAQALTPPAPADTPAPNAPILPGSPPAALTGLPGTALEIAQLLAAGTIDTAQAGKLSKAGNISTLDVAHALTTLRGAAQPQADTRTDAEKKLDRDFGPAAKPEQFQIRYYTPGQEPPVTPKEVKDFDVTARGWMADAGLPRELGNSLVNTLSKAIQHTHTLTADQREAYKDSENAKLHKLFGDPDKLEEALEPARQMIHELDQKRPGLKEFVRAHGDHALFVAQLVQAAKIYHARRKG